MKFRPFFSILLLIITFQLSAQETPRDWHLLDSEKDKVPGISLAKAYELLRQSDIQPSTVIVAVLDSGLDIDHEDIQPILWKNEDELAGNSNDDDGNGYVDDVIGWNFIGNANGENVGASTLEVTRLYRKYSEMFEGKNKFNISPEEKPDFEKFLIYKKAYLEGKEKLESRIEANEEEYEFFHDLIPPLQEAVGKNVFTERELKKAKIRKRSIDNLRKNFFRILERNKEKNLTSVKLIEHYEGLASSMEQMESRLKYNYNLTFDAREIIGDDYSNLNERIYGNADVSKRSEHGTHVSGIIAAVQDNGIGMDGIAENVLIMPIRNTPMGDEADKDVANGIRYAVDNGARIINMSFGKGFSPEKQVVDEAIKYAQENGVLLVHAAGNESLHTDYYDNFPTALFNDGTTATNLIEIGASSMNADENLPATFSNYGKYSVDIFAPGVDIYATLPNNEYGTRSGTSMAAPVVSGVAALLLSYFPKLTPEQVIEIISESGVSHNIMVKKPGSDEKVPFSSLSKTGKVVNAHNAVKMALETYQN